MLNLNEYCLIIFDFEGTIVDILQDWDNTLNDMKSATIGYFNGLMKCDSVVDFLYKAFELKNYKILIDTIQEHYETIAKFKVKQDVVDIIKQIHSNNNIKLTILTNNLRSTTINILKVIDNLDQYFEYIVGFEDVETCKPDPEGAIKILSKYEKYISLHNDKKILLIGDSINDENTANKVGIDFKHVDKFIEEYNETI